MSSETLKNPPLSAILAPDGSVTKDYEDVVEPRRGQSDLYWAAQEWESSGSFPGSKKIPSKQAIEKVMSSTGLQEIMAQVAKERNVPLKQVKNEAREILNIMGHQQDISAIRKFAFFLAKMVKAMYNKIVVHRPGIETLRKALQICPVVLLPTHRSYADFILVSYLSYHYNLPFPVIAAGMDFYHMTFIGQLLREAGAFYIKRSFMDDVLYWAIFQEYVKLLVCQESAPLEFFLEGTRSRTAKTLRPKLGLLGCICQYSCLEGVSDVLAVPINISYERTLEEELYAWELLGIPKPKESTSGLFKAKRILREQYGNVYVHIGKLTSVKSTMKACNFCPANLHCPLTVEQVGEVDKLALRLVREQMRVAAVSVFSMAAHYLLLRLQQNCSEVAYAELLHTVTEMVSSIQDPSLGSYCTALFGGYGLPGDVNACLLYALSVHSNLVCLRDDMVCFTPLMDMASSSDMSSDEKEKRMFVLHLMLQHYANQSIHVLVLPALLCVSVVTGGRSNDSATVQSCSAPMQFVKLQYMKLLQFFSFEFISPANADQAMTEAILRLCKSGCGILEDDILTIKRICTPSLAVLYLSCLNPFLLTYCTAVSVAVQREWPGTGALESAIQEKIRELCSEKFKQSVFGSKKRDGEVLAEGRVTDSYLVSGAEGLRSLALFSSLSLDAIKNSVKALVKTKAIQSTGGIAGGMVPSRRSLGDLFTLLTGNELPRMSHL